MIKHQSICHNYSFHVLRSTRIAKARQLLITYMSKDLCQILEKEHFTTQG